MVLSGANTTAAQLDLRELLASSADASMIVPAAFFLSLPERTSCRGSMETGSSIAAAGDKRGSYIKSIAKIVSRNGDVVGWVYLADDGSNKGTAEFVQANQVMNFGDMATLHLRAGGKDLSSVSRLKVSLPRGLMASKCTDAPSTH